MRPFLSSAVAALLLVPVAGAQGPGDKLPSVILAPIGGVELRAGSTASLEMAFRISDGFHINSNKPHSDFLIPTELKLNPPPQVAVADIKYPAGKDETFRFSPGEKLSVYSGDFSIDTMLKAPASAAPGNYAVKGELNYQACDKAACYPPKTMPVQFQVTVVK